MNFLEKLDYLMKRSGENPMTLAKRSGIPYTTINGFYKKGYSNTKLSTLMKLSDYFEVSLDYLVRENIDDPSYGKYSVIDDEEIELVKLHRVLNTEGRALAIGNMRALAGNPDLQKDARIAKAT